MKKLLFVWTIVWGIANLSGCGKDGVGQGKPPEPVTDAELTLVAFGAPWCTECKHDLPLIDKLLAAESDAVKSKVAKLLYVTSGETAAKKPTEKIAQDYRAALNLSFTAQMDPWRCQTYSKLMKNPGCQLPAIALLNKAGEVIKSFAPGTFVPEEIIAVVKENVK